MAAEVVGRTGDAPLSCIRAGAIAAVFGLMPLISWAGVHTSSRLLVLQAAVGCWVAAELIQGLRSGRWTWARPAGQAWVVAFVAWSLVSALWSQPIEPALGGAGALVVFGLLFQLGATSSGSERWLIAAGLTAGAGAAVWTWAQHLLSGTIRPAGPFGNPVTAGPYLGYVLMIALAWALERSRLLGAAAAALFASALWLTGCRAAVIGALLAGALLVDRWARARGQRRQAWSVMALVIVCGLLAGMWLREPIAERWWRHRPLTVHRLLFLRDGLELVKSAPLLGHGLGSFFLKFSSVRGQEYGQLGGPNLLLHAHNEYLELASELGLVGLGLFFAAVIAGLRAGDRAVLAAPAGSWERTWRLGLLAGSASLLVDNLANVDMRAVASAGLLWTGMGQLAAAERRLQETPLRRGRLALALAFGLVLVPFGITGYRQFRGQVEHIAGRHAHATARLEAAAAAYREALRWDRTNLLAIYDLGTVEGQRGRVREAYSALLAVYRLAPGFAGVAHNLGVLLVQAGKPREGLPYLEEASARDPANRTTRSWLERARGMIGQEDRKSSDRQTLSQK